MRFGSKEREERKRFQEEQRYRWHAWFAWYPVKVKPGRWAWLEVICRLRISDPSRDDPLGFYWVYTFAYPTHEEFKLEGGKK